MVKIVVILALVLTGCATKPIESCDSKVKAATKELIRGNLLKYIAGELTTTQYNNVVKSLEAKEALQLYECNQVK